MIEIDEIMHKKAFPYHITYQNKQPNAIVLETKQL
jgi:hypothetical protein